MFLVEYFQDAEVRFLKAPNGKPVIIAADLIKLLKGDKTNAAEIVKKYVREKWVIDLPNPNGGRAVKCIFEPGVYQLCGNPMFQTPFAFEFQDWIFEKVLPKLIASGYYLPDSATSETLEALKEEAESRLAKLQAELKESEVERKELRSQLEDVNFAVEKFFSYFMALNNFAYELVTDLSGMSELMQLSKTKQEQALRGIKNAFRFIREHSATVDKIYLYTGVYGETGLEKVQRLIAYIGRN